jgi:hypothetical protein
VLNTIKPRHIRPTFAVRFSILLAIVCLLPIASRLRAKVFCYPALKIFSAPGATQVFRIFVPFGTNLASFSVLTLGAPNLDFHSVSHATSCPDVVARTCTIEVQFQPTAPGKRLGAVVLKDAGGNVIKTIALNGSSKESTGTIRPEIISTPVDSGKEDNGSPSDGDLHLGPTGVAADGYGNTYVVDDKGNKIYKVTPEGVSSNFAGTGRAGYAGDGGPATSAQLSGPMSVVVDGAGFVYIADTGNNVIRMVNTAGIISTYAGQYYAPGTAPPPVCAGAKNSVGDGCPGNHIVLNTPVDLVLCNSQNLHISDKLNNRVRTVLRVNYRTITQVGNGMAGYNGEGELSTRAELNGPTGIAMDAANYIYVADSGNHIIRKTLLTGYTPNPIFTIAGTPGKAGNGGDSGPATMAKLNSPRGVQVDAAGNLYISDSDSLEIRKVSVSDGLISNISHTATVGYNGKGVLSAAHN